jgi:DNA processing protein
VESAQDVLEELQLAIPLEFATKKIAPYAATTGTSGLFGEDSPLLSALGFDAASLDTLQARTGLDTANLQAQLMALELDGEVARLPGGLFLRMAQS